MTAQKLPLVYITGVILVGVAIFATLIHFALQSWQSARLDLRERSQE